jgi:hypothetical protein
MPKNRKQKQQSAEKRRQKEMERKAQISKQQVSELAEKRANAPAKPVHPPAHKISFDPKNTFDIGKTDFAGDVLALQKSGLDTEKPENILWENFEQADLDGKVAIFLAALDAGEIDSEFAFEMFDVFDRQFPDDTTGHACFADLARRLREQAPQVYKKEKKYLHQDMLTHAIEDEQWEAIPALLSAFSDEDDLDTYYQMVDQMVYHGLVTDLIPVMQQNISTIEGSKNLFDWAADEFRSKIMYLTLWAYLNTSPAPRADDPALLEVSAPYGSWKPGWLERFIPRWTATQPSTWTTDDFGPFVDADQWDENLHNLLADFMADCHRQGIPLTRADMAWEQIAIALTKQASTPSNMPSPKKNIGKKAKALPHRPLSPLIPRFATLDSSLKDLLPFLGGRPYPLAATLELLPAYLHFVAALGLIHPTEMDEALQELQRLTRDVKKLLQYYNADGRCIANVLAAWSPEHLQMLQNDPALAEARNRPIIIQPQVPEIHKPTSATATYTFRVTYNRDSEIWRTIELLQKQTLHDLHEAIQDAVHFDNDHQYAFFMSNMAWDKDTEFAVRPDRGKTGTMQKTLASLGLRMKQRFLYIFDYGDEHRFEIQLLSANPNAPQADYPCIIETHGDNPPQYDWGEDDEEWEEEDDDNDDDETWDDEEEIDPS